MNATEVYNAVKQRFSDTRRYAIATEVGLSTGGSRRRLDVVVVDCYNSNNFRIDGIEIKVSKADLRRELEDPDKHAAFFEYIDYYTLACPQGIADLKVIPPKWGVLTCYEDGTARYMRRPLALHDAPNRTITRGFFAGYVRAIQHYAPSAEVLEAEHKRGFEEGRAAERRHNAYVTERVNRDAAKLEDYEKLRSRLHLWGEDYEKQIAEFERFRAANPEMLRHHMQRAVRSFEQMLQVFEEPQPVSEEPSP